MSSWFSSDTTARLCSAPDCERARIHYKMDRMDLWDHWHNFTKNAQKNITLLRTDKKRKSLIRVAKEDVCKIMLKQQLYQPQFVVHPISACEHLFLQPTVEKIKWMKGFSISKFIHIWKVKQYHFSAELPLSSNWFCKVSTRAGRSEEAFHISYHPKVPE